MEGKKVELNLGSVCNNACKFCMNDEPLRERKFISFELLKKEIRDFYGKDYRLVGFLGGEPTIYPRLIEIIKFASSSGYRGIHLVSNGRKYSDKDFLNRLIEAGASRFYVSIHSHKPEIEDFLTSVKGCFKEKLKGISNLVFFRNKGLIKDPILLNTVINKLNYRYLPEIILFYRKNFHLRNFRFNFIRPAGMALKNFRLLVPKYLQIKKYLFKTMELSQQLKVNVTFETIPFCLLAEVKNFQDFIGEFRDGIRQAKVGITNREVFFIEQRRKDELKIKKESCRRCIYDLSCEGPWKNYVKVYHFQEFRPKRHGF